MKINQRGFWENPNTEGHAYDAGVSQAIMRFLNAHKLKTVVDIGCGPGQYAKIFKRFGFEVEAYDGNPNTPELTGGIGQVMDFSHPIALCNSYDLVMSLEVGEHIPEEFEQIFIDNLTRHAKNYIILSWAIPDQVGDGHVNCRPNSYIRDKMAAQGFIYNQAETLIMRRMAKLWWFKNTIMVFEKLAK